VQILALLSCCPWLHFFTKKKVCPSISKQQQNRNAGSNLDVILV